jgi:hypothetical protein
MRRRRQRWVIGAVCVGALAASSFGAWVASAATASSGKECARSSTYGSQCLEVLGSGRRVTEIQTWFDDTGMFWPKQRWRIDLERYSCDPVRTTKAICPATTTWHGRTFTGVRVVHGQAQPLHLAQSWGNGYWTRFALPHTFASNVRLCTEVAVYNRTAHRWVYNAAGLPNGLRACVSVDR